MSAAPKPTKTDGQSAPGDSQSQRLRLKREAVDLGAFLASYGARVQIGKTTRQRALLEVRQETRVRQDVVITYEDDGVVYSVGDGGQRKEYVDREALRLDLIAPPPKWQWWWRFAVIVVVWALVSIGLAVLASSTKMFTKSQAYWILPTVLVAGVILSIAASGIVRRIRRARRAHRVALKLTGRA